MFDIDREAGTDPAALDPAGLDRDEVLAAALSRRRTADAAEAELLVLAAHWADLHPVVEAAADGFPVPGMEQVVPLAGDGAPEVAEFAAAELAAVLGMSSHAGRCLVGDALELRHRLPRLWSRVLEGVLPAWRARRIAEQTRSLSLEAAAFVDAQLAPFAHKIGPVRVAACVDAAMLRFDPEQAARRARAAQETRGVWLGDQMTDGTRSIQIEADALDAAAFDSTITAIAEALAGLGDQDTTDVRRAKAVGVIADAQGVLALLEPDSGEGPAGDGFAARVAGGASRRPKVVLYVHLHADVIAGGARLAGRVEGLGPVSVEMVREWVGRSDLTITPVVDLADRTPVDAHEAPARMREQVLLRDAHCPFPWCNNASRRRDLDHIEPFVDPADGGPPGQTIASNLAALCRTHHRLKTHGGWTYSMPESGSFVWRSPGGHRYLVDHTGTTRLG